MKTESKTDESVTSQIDTSDFMTEYNSDISDQSAITNKPINTNTVFRREPIDHKEAVRLAMLRTG